MITCNNKNQKKKFFLALCVTVLAVAWPSLLYAQNVTFPEAVNIYLSTQDLTYKLGAGTFSSLTVNGNSFTVTTGSTDSVYVSSAGGKSLENDRSLSTTCQGAESSALVSANTTVTFTPIGTTVCPVTVMEGGNNGGGGGGGGSGTGGPSPSPAPSSSPTSSSGPSPGVSPSSSPAINAIKVARQKIAFKDLSGTLNITQIKIVYEVAQKMVDQHTFVTSPTQEFKPYYKTTRFFALQTALAVAGDTCGEVVNFTTCENAALKAGLVDPNNLPDRFITRAQFYDMLIRAVKIPLLKSPALIEKNLCNDVEVDNEFAAVVATARYNAIAPLYAGRVCNADLAFPRYSAAVFASRTLAAKRKLL